MKIFTKYFLKEFLKLLVLCQAIFMTIYLTMDFFQKIDNFIEAKVSGDVIIAYFVYKLPYLIMQLLPPAVLISVIVFLSTMKKRQEITAVKACGLSIYQMVQPLLVASFFIGVFVFFISEVIVPVTSTKSNELWNKEVEKYDSSLFYGSHQIWYKGKNAIYWIKHFDYETNTMFNPTFYFFDENFRLIRKIDGTKGVWKEGSWEIEKGSIQEIGPGGSYKQKKFDFFDLEIPENPKTFIRNMKRPEEMSYWQIKDYAERVSMEGYDNTRYLVDMHIKFAFPLVSLVLASLGISIALRLNRGGIPLAVTVGIGSSFFYLLVLGLSRSLGLSNILPPMLSAWMANFIFVLAGVYLMMHLER